MHETLSSLVERALNGNRRPLEFYLREQSRLPGKRANLELAIEFSNLLGAVVPEYARQTRELLTYLLHDGEHIEVNTPGEFVVLCGIVASGACAAVLPGWREEIYKLLGHYASSLSWRVREAVAMGFQQLLPAAPEETIAYLMTLAAEGDNFQQRASIAAVAEPPLLHAPEIVNAALSIQRLVLERMHSVPIAERKREDFRALRQALGYTLSVVTAAAPEKGFALMSQSASWNDPDINWILRENLKKKRLAKFAEHTEKLSRMLA
ncbi:MAG TPA: hypothetical protein VFA09_24260 [Ktedonobacteraceae bacterium]|nr:hypothetical protein [Ktedonobacteraceae bacterium]